MKDIFALLDAMKSDEKGDIDNLMNGPYTKFVANKEVSAFLQKKDKFIYDEADILSPDVNNHIVLSNNERRRY